MPIAIKLRFRVIWISVPKGVKIMVFIFETSEWSDHPETPNDSLRVIPDHCICMYMCIKFHQNQFSRFNIVINIHTHIHIFSKLLY